LSFYHLHFAIVVLCSDNLLGESLAMVREELRLGVKVGQRSYDDTFTNGGGNDGACGRATNDGMISQDYP